LDRVLFAGELINHVVARRAVFVENLVGAVLNIANFGGRGALYLFAK
jgi:hypothetical protein